MGELNELLVFMVLKGRKDRPLKQNANTKLKKCIRRCFLFEKYVRVLVISLL